MNRPWTRAEKWLFAAPLLLAIATLAGVQGPEAIRKARGYPLELPASPSNSLSSIALSGNGQTLVAGEQIIRTSKPPFNKATSSIIYLWDVRTLRPLPPLARPAFLGTKRFDEDTFCVALTADAKTLAWGAPASGMTVSDVKTRRALWTSGKSSAYHAAFSPDGNWLALGGNSLSIFQARTGKVVTRWQPRPSPGENAFGFSPHGRWFASTSPRPAWDDWMKVVNEKGSDIELRRTSDWKIERVFPLPNTIAITFAPDERTLVGVARDYIPSTFGISGSRVRCFDVRTGKVEWELDSRSNPLLKVINDACFSPDGATVAVLPWGNQVFLLDAKTGGIVRTLPIPAGKETKSFFPHALVFSPDGKRLFGRGKSAVFVWDLG